MKKHILLVAGLFVAVMGCAGLPAHAQARELVSAESVMGQGNTAVLTQTFVVLQGTLDELRDGLAKRNIAEPEKISGMLSAIRGNLLAIDGTIAALDARASRLAADETPSLDVALGPTTVMGTGMSYDGIPVTQKSVEGKDVSASGLETASILNIGRRAWPVALIVLALAIPFLFKKNGDEPSVVIKTVEAPAMQEFEAPLVPVTRRNA